MVEDEEGLWQRVHSERAGGSANSTHLCQSSDRAAHWLSLYPAAWVSGCVRCGWLVVGVSRSFSVSLLVQEERHEQSQVTRRCRRHACRGNILQFDWRRHRHDRHHRQPRANTRRSVGNQPGASGRAPTTRHSPPGGRYRGKGGQDTPDLRCVGEGHRSPRGFETTRAGAGGGARSGRLRGRRWSLGALPLRPLVVTAVVCL